MLLIKDTFHDPYLNLAAEEYLLKYFSQDVFMLYRNPASVIVGKHQNMMAEINLAFVRKNHIPVVRRLTGGGTVFHDPGNVNFCFIMNGEAGKLVDFRKYTQPILDVLKTMGLDAKFEGKNDLRINGLKFSGNAEHVFKKRVLHHGTILYSSELGKLSEAIKVTEGKYFHKSVQSVRSKVTNIQSLLNVKLSVEDFMSEIYNFIEKKNLEAEIYSFSKSDIKEIESLAKIKFKSFDWNFGRNPDYIFRNKKDNLSIELTVKKSIIEKAQISSESISQSKISHLQNELCGLKHDFDEINNLLKNHNFDDEIIQTFF
jgi:lipoate-protein ligase A